MWRLNCGKITRHFARWDSASHEHRSSHFQSTDGACSSGMGAARLLLDGMGPSPRMGKGDQQGQKRTQRSDLYDFANRWSGVQISHPAPIVLIIKIGRA